MSFMGRMKHGLNVTKFKADQMLRINKIRNDIAALQAQISDIYTEIARTAMAMHKQSNLANPELERLCVAVDDLNNKTAEKESMIASIQAEDAPRMPESYQTIPQNPCLRCQYDVPAGAEFCPNCGNTMPRPVAQSETANAEEEEYLECTKCNFRIAPEVTFCPNCGHPVHRP